MTLLGKIKRLISADAYAIVDELEEPKRLLTHSLREMDEELEKIKDELRIEDVQKKDIEAKMARLEIESQTCENKISLAMSEKREDLAKKMIRKQLTMNQHLKSLQDKLEVCKKNYQRLSDNYEEKKTIFEDLKLQASSIVWPEVRDNVSDQSIQTHDIESEIELEFMRRMNNMKEAQNV